MVSIVLVSQQQPGEQTTAAGRPRPSGMGTALLSGVAIGFFFLSLAQTDSSAGMWPLVAARLVSVVLFGGIALATRASVRMPAGVAALAVACGVVDMLANALYLLAARLGALSVVVTLSSLYPASTVLLARIVLHERLNLWQVTGVGCALIAVVLIVRGS
jgi:drug/metabolite transporter (DMT)-like permease